MAHLILEGNPLLPRQQLPQLVEIRPLPESVEPDESANNDNAECVDDQGVVEQHEGHGNMVALNDGRHRDDEGDQQ